MKDKGILGSKTDYFSDSTIFYLLWYKTSLILRPKFLRFGRKQSLSKFTGFRGYAIKNHEAVFEDPYYSKLKSRILSLDKNT